MNPQWAFAEFRDTFLANVRLRSRTVKGNVQHTNVSVLKLPLLLEGRRLQEQLATNLQITAEMLYCTAAVTHSINYVWCKAAFNAWFDRLQDGLLDMLGYKEKARSLGISVPNPRYRIWEVSYNPASPKPTEIDERMQVFYKQLTERMLLPVISSDKRAMAELLAFADRELDSVIHPWLDGCGRFATAVVMWIAARVPQMPLPQYGGREEHYKAIETLESHTEYFLRCLNR